MEISSSTRQRFCNKDGWIWGERRLFYKTPRLNSAVEMVITWQDLTHLSVAIQRLYWRHGHNAQVNVSSVFWCFMLILTPFYGFDIISSILIKHCDYWYFFLVWWLLIEGRDPKGATEVPPLLIFKKNNLIKKNFF